MKKAGRRYTTANEVWMWVNVALIIGGCVLAIVFRHHRWPAVVFIAATISMALRMTVARRKGIRR